MERMWLLFGPWGGPGQSEALHLPSSDLGMCILPTIPAVRSIFQDSLGRVRCGWDHLDGICNWAQLWRLCKLFRLAGRYGDVTVLCWPKTSLGSKFPYLLKLPSSSLEWLSLSLASPCSVCVNQHLVLEEHKLGHSTLPLTYHPNTPSGLHCRYDLVPTAACSSISVSQAFTSSDALRLGGLKAFLQGL